MSFVGIFFYKSFTFSVSELTVFQSWFQREDIIIIIIVIIIIIIIIIIPFSEFFLPVLANSFSQESE